MGKRPMSSVGRPKRNFTQVIFYSYTFSRIYRPFNAPSSTSIQTPTQEESSEGTGKAIPRPKLGSKNAFYGSQPYLLASNIKHKIGIYNEPIKPIFQTIGNDGKGVPTGITGLKHGKRPISKYKKRKRPRSSKKKRSFNFLDNYVTEQYNEYKRKASQNHLIKVKMYKEIGMPPLPVSEKRRSGTIDNRQPSGQDDKQSSNQ